MKKNSIAFVIFITLITWSAFAANYNADYLEDGNTGGWETSLKTFDEIITTVSGETFFVDIWMRAGSLPIHLPEDSQLISRMTKINLQSRIFKYTIMKQEGCQGHGGIKVQHKLLALLNLYQMALLRLV